MSIEVKDLLKVYGEQKAVNNISFKINRGEIVGFLGPNGAGKSTTMKIITGYIRPNAGDAWVAGINVAERPLETKRKIGYLPELNALYYDMYVKEYLRFIGELHHVAEIEQTVNRVIETVGLTAEKRKKIGQLSKGYKQRVGLAAALVHDPEVLILDEPTSGLDPNQIIEIRELIKQQGLNKTVLFSSHILQEVEAICDRVIIIHKGNLVADDQLSRLRSNTGSNIIKVEFRETVQAGLLSALPAADSVNQTGVNQWELSTQDPQSLRKQVMELSLQHNLNIISFHSENQSLEDIFRAFTGG